MIASGTLHPTTLAGHVAIVTGAGGGIGFEAARALLWLGASVTIAEIDEAGGKAAAERLTEELGHSRVMFVGTDVGDPESVARMVSATEARFGAVDIVLNNATVAPAGLPVTETPIIDWDRSYAVNLRGPVLLARACLPSMVSRGHGVFVCVSSTGGPYLGAYETLKSAQLTLADTLDAELAGTGVTAFTIGPGLVGTPTATAAIQRVAPRLGLSLDEFYLMNRGAMLSVEAAGTGFAAAIASAAQYAGQEISSSQALIDAGIDIPEEVELPAGVRLAPAIQEMAVARASRAAAELCDTVHATLVEQADGWRERSFFERQWMVRDFRKRAGMPVEGWIEELEKLATFLHAMDEGQALAHVPNLPTLAGYYGHTGDLARGYIKDPVQRDVQLAVIHGWQSDVERLQASLHAPRA